MCSRTSQRVEKILNIDFFPKCLTDLSLMMGDKEKKKKEKERKLGITNTLQNRALIIP
jgi:hypothetical protein